MTYSEDRDLRQQKVVSGLYNNASEVVREALRIAASCDGFELLQSETSKGIAQLREGKGAPLNVAKARRTAVANSRKDEPSIRLSVPER